MTSLGNKFIQFSVSPFYNYFLNYVYLTPTTEQWYGFPVYRYRQQNAQQYGFEAGMNINIIKDLTFKTSYSGMESKTADGDFTPFIPAQKYEGKLSYTIKMKNESSTLTIFSKGEYYLKQYHLAPYEVGTPDYWLLQAGVTSFLKFKNKEMDISIVGNNLLNETYYSHLSRFKSLGIFNVGRSVSINFKFRFLGTTKK